MTKQAILIDTKEILTITDSRLIDGEYEIYCINSKGKEVKAVRSELLYKVDIDSIRDLQQKDYKNLKGLAKNFYDKKLKAICKRLKMRPIEILNFNVNSITL